MTLLEWINVKPLVNKNAINDFEKKYKLTLPEDFKKCVANNNAGSPTYYAIKAKTGDEFDVKTLLSFNENDVENIYKIIDYFINQFCGKIIPFASDSAGNYYCFDDNKVILLTQDDDIIPICDSFSDFIGSLYEA